MYTIEGKDGQRDEFEFQYPKKIDSSYICFLCALSISHLVCL